MVMCLCAALLACSSRLVDSSRYNFFFLQLSLLGEMKTVQNSIKIHAKIHGQFFNQQRCHVWAHQAWFLFFYHSSATTTACTVPAVLQAARGGPRRGHVGAGLRAAWARVGGSPAAGTGVTSPHYSCTLVKLRGRCCCVAGPGGARPLNLHACRVPTRRAGDGEEAAKPAMGRRFLFPGKRVTTAGVTAASHGMMIL